MNFFESLNMALSSIIANKMRSFLTMLGVVIGVAAIVSLISVGRGASESITSSIKGLGTNLLFVTPGQRNSEGPGSSGGSAQNLTYKDAKAIEQTISNIKAVSPEVSKNYAVSMGNQDTTTSIVGSSAEYQIARNIVVNSGRFIGQDDISGTRKVAVLGETVIGNLGGGNLIGKRILVNRIPFTVVGSMKAKGQTGFLDQDNQIIIPITTAFYRLAGDTSLNTIGIAVDSENNMDKVRIGVEKLLRKRHRLRLDDPSDFTVRSQLDILGTLTNITGIFTVLLGGIASISLLVGGIGIMNIMLVSVTERTREIGIRKALGARRRDILAQFLIESIVLSGLGGIVGLIFGIIGSKMISNVGGFSTTIELTPIILAFSFSLAVGVFFGVYPARKAALLDPIEALRYE
jgi:putative ABC transport system permease protein